MITRATQPVPKEVLAARAKQKEARKRAQAGFPYKFITYNIWEMKNPWEKY